MTQAANDLNFTFVIDESQGDRLVHQLHERLIQSIGLDKVLGPTWKQLFSDEKGAAGPLNWWEEPHNRRRLIEIATRESAAFVYSEASLDAAITAVLGVRSVKRWAYAMKANWHPQLLRRIYAAGLTLECVSRGELDHAFDSVPRILPERVLFTPNFAPREDYAWALTTRATISLDSLYQLEQWGELFRAREVVLRIDLGRGLGHHEKVRTGGSGSKFGLPVEQVDAFLRLADTHGVIVRGLHAHLGSGILDDTHWGEVYGQLASLAERIGSVTFLDIGGGLGVPSHPGEARLDIAALDRVLREVKAAYPHYKLWMEPGRYLVADAGVLLTRVTQTKGKGHGTVRYLGVDTGMNSLIRPALYEAWHEIVNLTRLGEPATALFQVVGPICESGDVLGTDRRLPEPEEGDVMLIAQAGAYGKVMSSPYNLRDEAEEIIIE